MLGDGLGMGVGLEEDAEESAERNSFLDKLRDAASPRLLAIVGAFAVVLCLPFVLVWASDSGVEALETAGTGAPVDEPAAGSFKPSIRGGGADPDGDGTSQSVSSPVFERIAPVVELLRTILTGNYQRDDEVAVGRFLEEFSEMLRLLAGVKTDQLTLAKKGPTWAVFTAPWEPPDGLAGAVRLRDGRAVAHLRFVRVDLTWKLEHLKLLRLDTPLPR